MNKDIKPSSAQEPEGEKEYMNGLTRRYGRTPEYQYNGPKCVPECQNFPHYETKHHSSCPFYPNSLSEKYDKIEAAFLPPKEQGSAPEFTGTLFSKKREHVPSGYTPDLSENEWFVKWDEPIKGLKNLSLPIHPRDDFHFGTTFKEGQEVAFTKSYFCDIHKSWDCAKLSATEVIKKTRSIPISTSRERRIFHRMA